MGGREPGRGGRGGRGRGHSGQQGGHQSGQQGAGGSDQGQRGRGRGHSGQRERGGSQGSASSGASPRQWSQQQSQESRSYSGSGESRNRERQYSEQSSVSGSDGGGDRQYGSHRGRGGFGRGGGGGGGGGGGRGGGFDRGGGGRDGSSTKFVDPGQHPDPYLKPYKEAERKYGWKEPKAEKFVVQKLSWPAQGWSKTEIMTAVNHFPLKPVKSVNGLPIPPVFYQYNIEMEIVRERDNNVQAPNKPSASKPNKGKPRQAKESDATLPKKQLPRALSHLILQTLIPRLRRNYGFHGIITDNKHYLYSTKDLQDIMGGVFDHEIRLEDIEHIDEDEGKGVVKVSFKPTGLKIDTVSLAKFYTSNGLSLKQYDIDADSKQTLEAALNAVVRSFPRFRYVSVGRSSLVRWENGGGSAGFSLGGGLVAWKGVSANITMGWKPYFNVDIANCAFWIGEKVLDVLRQMFEMKRSRANVSDVTNWRDDAWKLAKYLNSCKVHYMSGGQKFGATIKNVIRETVTQKKFKMGDNGPAISIFDYFTMHRGTTLHYPRGPVLQLGETKFVPAEICTIKKGQSYNRRELMSDTQTTAILRKAQQKPGELKRDIEKQVEELQLGSNEVLKELEISIPSKMLELKARVLVPPCLRYGKELTSNNDAIVTASEKGQWEAFGKRFRFYRPSAKVENWGVLCTDGTATNDFRIAEFCESLVRNAERIGMHFAENPCVLESDRLDEFQPERNMKRLCDLFKKQFKDCKLVIVVLPRKNSPLYGHVKHASEIKTGMLTQCVIAKNLFDERHKKTADATVQNILLKINSKLGGVNHVTVPPLNRELAQKFCNVLMECPVLIMGADVTHPGKTFGDKANEFTPSYAAVTGSIDKTCMPFMTELRAQVKANRGAAEVINDMEDIVKSFLVTFKTKVGIPPWKIIFIRDGVGEGQFPELLHKEMKAIRNACAKAGGEHYQPKITFITAQKRHKTRIFHMIGNNAGQAPPGTVIDSEIVHTTENDFYLLSHHGLQGTSRPTRYHVLWDDSDFLPDEIQSMIYTLCYMYCRCTKSVSLPAPTYYAHLAADRAKKLCEGFEGANPTVQSLNDLLKPVARNMKTHPMHFV